jgi:hypothetical protein
MMTKAIRLVALFLGLAALSSAQDKPADPHAAHHAGVDARGDHAMGFDHAKTTHHFILEKYGGTIRVNANDAKDVESRDQVRQHLGHIAKMFAAGDFSAPMFIHDVVPPGVETMKRLKARIRYAYEPVDRGGRVVIRSSSPEAVAAVHDFLRFQIKDHRTGDLELLNRPASPANQNF